MIFACLTKYEFCIFLKYLLQTDREQAQLIARSTDGNSVYHNYGVYNVSNFVCIVDICKNWLYLTGDHTGPVLTEYYIPRRVFICAVRLAQTVRHWLHTAEPRVQYWVTSCEIRGGRSGTREGFSPSFLGFPLLIIIRPLLHILLPSPSEVCDSHEKAANCNIHDGGASSLTRYWLVTK
jgi:hypothetical protein